MENQTAINKNTIEMIFKIILNELEPEFCRSNIDLTTDNVKLLLKDFGSFYRYGVWVMGKIASNEIASMDINMQDFSKTMEDMDMLYNDIYNSNKSLNITRARVILRNAILVMAPIAEKLQPFNEIINEVQLKRLPRKFNRNKL